MLILKKYFEMARCFWSVENKSLLLNTWIIGHFLERGREVIGTYQSVQDSLAPKLSPLSRTIYSNGAKIRKSYFSVTYQILVVMPLKKWGCMNPSFSKPRILVFETISWTPTF